MSTCMLNSLEAVQPGELGELDCSPPHHPSPPSEQRLRLEFNQGLFRLASPYNPLEKDLHVEFNQSC